MIIEIERKYLVKYLPEHYDFKYNIISGYTSKETSSRVNYIFNDSFEEGFVTFKSKGTLSRKEYEYKIDPKEAKEMVNDKSICPFVIKKERREINIDNLLWEVDVYEPLLFNGQELSLVLAEVELTKEDQKIDLPDWIGEEVTEFKKYKNHYLAINNVQR